MKLNDLYNGITISFKTQVNIKIILTFFLAIFFFLGIAFIISAVLTKRYLNKKKAHCTKNCSGRIVDCIQRNISSGNDVPMYSYFPKYEYKVENDYYVVVGSLGKRKKEDIIIGETSLIYYNPNKKEEAIIAKENPYTISNVFFITGIALIGIVLLVLGILLYITIK